MYFSPKLRKCQFPDEGNLQHFAHYSEANCQMECLWKKAYDLCGCKPWYIPTLDGEETCFYLGGICFNNIINKYQKEEKASELACDCPRSCDYNAYTLSLASKAKENVISFCTYNDISCYTQWGKKFYRYVQLD